VATNACGPLLGRALASAAGAEVRVERVCGPDGWSVAVAVQGERNKAALITYHDLGLNYLANFHVKKSKKTSLFIKNAFFCLFSTFFCKNCQKLQALSLPSSKESRVCHPFPLSSFHSFLLFH